MTKYLRNYKREVEEILKIGGEDSWDKVLKNHRAVIRFLQHERLIHLLVTLFFGLIFCLFVTVNLIFQKEGLILVNFLVTILLIGYIIHYFRLENGIQKLYKLDQEIEDKL
jgi:hypothetical protein